MASVSKRKWVHNGQEKTAWTVRYKDGKVHRSIACANENEANKIRRSIERDIKAGISPRSAAGLITLRQAPEFFLRMSERRWKAGDIGHERYSLFCRVVDADIASTVLGQGKLSHVRPLAVQEWADQLATKHSPNRVRSAVDTLGLILDEALRLEFVTRNVVRDVPPRLPRVRLADRAVPALEEVRAILEHADPSSPCGLAIHLAVRTGLRVGEISALKWAHVDLDRSALDVRYSFSREGLKEPKSKAGRRTVPLAPALVGLLRDWKSQRSRRHGEFVFPCLLRNHRGGSLVRPVERPIPASKLSRGFGPILAAAGLAGRGYTFHSLRHVAASLFIEQGLPPKHVQTIMGHASIQMTFDRYGHLLHDDGKGAAASEAIERHLMPAGVL